MTSERPDWLIVERRDAPLIVSIPHAGTDLLGFEPAFVNPWLARKDADWRLDALYDFVASARRDIGADAALALDHRRQSRSERRLALSRPSDDGTLSRRRPSTASRSIGRARRRTRPKSPSGGVFTSIPTTRRSPSEIARLRQKHQRVALFDAHSIRSIIPRLFDGELPVFNLGTNSGASCSPELRETIGAVLAASGQTSIVDGRFKGGWITRAYGRPSEGVEALQLELACRAYMHEPERPTPENWPTPIDEKRAAPTRATIKRVLEAILECVSP